MIDYKVKNILPTSTFLIKELGVQVSPAETVSLTQYSWPVLSNAQTIKDGLNTSNLLFFVDNILLSTSDAITYLTSTTAGGSGEINTASNVGGGTEVFKQKVAKDLEFKTFVGGTNITLSATVDEITINSSAASGDLLAANNLTDVANAATSLSNLGGETAFSKNTAFNKNFGVTSGTVLEGDKNAAIVLNTAKVTNATHTGEVTGSGALTVGSTAISNKSLITAASGMEALVNDAGTLKKVNVSDFLGGGGSETFTLQRIETINNATATDLEYFTFAQNGTQISNSITVTGGDYLYEINFICLNTSSSGRVVVSTDIDGSAVFSQSYKKQPNHSSERFYVSLRKKITLAAGSRVIKIKFLYLSFRSLV